MEGTNYQIAVDKGWQDVKARDPRAIAAWRSAQYCDEKKRFTVSFLGEDYVLDCQSRTIARAADGRAPDVMAAILILNYLSFADGAVGREGKWVSLKEIPNGGVLFYPAFLKTAIASLVDAFGCQPQKLLRAGQLLHGRQASFGSASVSFDVFGEVPLCIVIWEGDEEVCANATVLYDPSVAQLLHIESVIGAGMYVAEQLVSLSKTL